MGPSEAIYSAESQARSPGHTLAAMLGGVRSGRYMGYRLFLRDIRGDYARSRFAVIWDFAEPLVIALVFVSLYQSGVISSGEIDIPYPAFVAFGVLLWQTFVDAITLPLEVPRASRNLITQLKIAPESLLIAVFLRVGFSALFRIAVLLLVALWTNTFHPFGFAAFVVLFPALIVCGMAIGVLLAPFNTLYADVGRVVRIVLRPLMFATPVLWAIPRFNFFSYALVLNPAATLITNLRALATQAVLPEPLLLVVTTGVMGVVFIVGWFVFHVSIPILAERV